MQRNIATYPLAETQVNEMKSRMLHWSARFGVLLFLDSNDFRSPYSVYECLLAADMVNAAENNGQSDGLKQLQQLHDTTKDWLFGHICYDYKNVLEPKLESAHEPKTDFPLLHFFTPATVCHINKEKTTFTIEAFGDPNDIYKAILGAEPVDQPLPHLSFSRVIPKEVYRDTISRLRRHIADGDCYEINFCNEGFCNNADIQPLAAFSALNKLSPAPFAAFYRLGDKYMMCASPERYLLKKGRKIFSQPMKGTARRDTDAVKDEQIKNELQSSLKERAENVMITDLVRNDLARCCETGSVQVEELFGIHSFPQVHQMVSTISGTLKDDMPFTNALRYSFPMGSMTGAPKFKVMQLTEQYEQSRRELFSGTVGYITPSGDFDFNVIIRSLFYNTATRYLCYQTGGAITYDSDPLQEWEETRLKAWALERIFA